MAAGVRLNRTVSQSLMAKLVTTRLGELGSEKTVSQPQWSNYESESDEPSAIVYRATADVSGISESYIAFGLSSAPPAAMPDPRLDRKLNPQELARAVAQADREDQGAPKEAAGSRRKKTAASKRRGGSA